MADRIAARAKTLCLYPGLGDSHAENHTVFAIRELLTELRGDEFFREIDRTFDARVAKGLATYGTTLSGANLTEAECLQHAREEAADLLMYLLKLAEIRAAKKENPDA